MEKVIKPTSGWVMLFVVGVLIALDVYFFSMIVGSHGTPQLSNVALLIITLLAILVIIAGFKAIEPNMSRVFTLFGGYVGTVRESGFYHVNPFYKSVQMSQRAVTLDIPIIKVNDKQGNPIMIGAVVAYRVLDTYKASFDVENLPEFVKIQSETAVRKLAGLYSYDNFEDHEAGATLRTSSDEVNHELAREITERLQLAGIEVIDARINHLAYSTEIAGAMLQRQQATAVIAARGKIVEGAVGMVELALAALSEKNIVHLDDERKAAMVSNLLVVLCSDHSVSPVINAGTLYQ
jgi:regulator of protease activity HflC (stomatin/prohibitin superfamily)